jgi:hypothetical protein
MHSGQFRQTDREALALMENHMTGDDMAGPRKPRVDPINGARVHAG